MSRIFRRGPWENAASALIALGVFMLMQPFSMWLYSNSFLVILAGTIGFVIVSHFPENGAERAPENAPGNANG